MRRIIPLIGCLVLSACGFGHSPSPTSTSAAGPSVPLFSHVVVVVEENHSQEDIMGAADAPYINWLAHNGANMTQSFAVAHPSEPNYLALFAGSTFNVVGDPCPIAEGNAPNLASELLAARKTFVGYADGLPATGSAVCDDGDYARKHVPWSNFTNVPGNNSMPFTVFPSPPDFNSLPTVSFVIPNLANDMHNGTVAQGDAWLHTNIDPYAQWARANNSLLIVTWDESDLDGILPNQIPTIFYGAHVKTGNYTEHIDHYYVLATLEHMYGLALTGAAQTASPIADIWN